MEINIKDYLSEEEIKEIVKDELHKKIKYLIDEEDSSGWTAKKIKDWVAENMVLGLLGGIFNTDNIKEIEVLINDKVKEVLKNVSSYELMPSDWRANTKLQNRVQELFIEAAENRFAERSRGDRDKARSSAGGSRRLRRGLRASRRAHSRNLLGGEAVQLLRVVRNECPLGERYDARRHRRPTECHEEREECDYHRAARMPDVHQDHFLSLELCVRDRGRSSAESTNEASRGFEVPRKRVRPHEVCLHRRMKSAT
jgi:hypothetical protein